MKKFVLILLAAVLLLGACTSTTVTPSPPMETSSQRVDFTSHDTDYSILVRNNSSERLVAFKNELKDDTLIGGIPARAPKHGLPLNLSLFDKTEDFALILITEAQYNAYKGNFSPLKYATFTQIYAFFNKDGTHTAVYEIAAALGGNNKLNIINASTNINIELHLGSPTGSTLGYAPAGMLETTFRMRDGNYQIFPVFKRYNIYRGIMDTVYPKEGGSDNAWSQSFSFGGGTTRVAINLMPLLQSTNFPSGVAWVIVDNQTDDEIYTFKGNLRLTNLLGTGITSGNSETFQINMPKMENDQYAESLTENWRFGPTGFAVSLQKGENDSTPLGPLTVEQNKMYTVTVTGDHKANKLKAWISKVTDLDELISGR
jgi:hypothetical protein